MMPSSDKSNVCKIVSCDIINKWHTFSLSISDAFSLPDYNKRLP